MHPDVITPVPEKESTISIIKSKFAKDCDLAVATIKGYVRGYIYGSNASDRPALVSRADEYEMSIIRLRDVILATGTDTAIESAGYRIHDLVAKAINSLSGEQIYL